MSKFSNNFQTFLKNFQKVYYLGKNLMSKVLFKIFFQMKKENNEKLNNK